MELLQKVNDNDCCIACGACIAACLEKAIRPAYSSSRGAWEIKLIPSDACSECNRACEQVCPGIMVDIADLAQAARIPVPMERTGNITGSWVGFAPPFRNNGISSSGGVVRAIAAHFISRSVAVICLARSDGEYRARTLHRSEDIALLPGSIYHSIPTHGFIEQIKALRNPAVLIATPCQLEGILGWIRHCAPAARDRLLLTVGIICGWMFTDHTVKAFAHFKGIDEDIQDIGYRGEDKYGYFKLRTPNGWKRYHRRHFNNEEERHDFSSACGSAANRLRCRLCENHLNLLSDLCVGDAWLQRCRKDKSSILIARSRDGAELIQHLESTGELVLTPGRPGDLIESQSENLASGIDARIYKSWLNERGRFHGQYVFPFDDGLDNNPDRADRLHYRIEERLRLVLRSGRYDDYRRQYLRMFAWRMKWPRRPLTMRRNMAQHTKQNEGGECAT